MLRPRAITADSLTHLGDRILSVRELNPGCATCVAVKQLHELLHGDSYGEESHALLCYDKYDGFFRLTFSGDEVSPENDGVHWQLYSTGTFSNSEEVSYLMISRAVRQGQCFPTAEIWNQPGPHICEAAT